MEIKDLAIYFDGYLDAVGRQFSTNETLVALSSRVLDGQVSIEDILSSNEYKFIAAENNEINFEEDISTFLVTDPRERLLFYLVEYFEWFKQFSETYSCEKLHLSGDNAPDKYLGYLLTCNKNIKIFVYIYEKPKL